jgi:hypothetical protein
MDQRFRNHPKNKGKARKADKKVKTIAGRLVRELERKLSPSLHQSTLTLFKKVLAQKKTDRDKIYSLHSLPRSAGSHMSNASAKERNIRSMSSVQRYPSLPQKIQA